MDRVRGAIFSYNATFSKDDPVVVWRSKGGPIQGWIASAAKLHSCPITSGTRHECVGYKVCFGTSFKLVPTMMIGKISTTAGGGSGGVRNKNGRVAGAVASDSDVSRAIFSSSSKFSVGDWVLVCRTNGGIVYGKIKSSKDSSEVCPTDMKTEHLVTRWNVGLQGSSYKVLPANWMGKIPLREIVDDNADLPPRRMLSREATQLGIPEEVIVIDDSPSTSISVVTRSTVTPVKAQSTAKTKTSPEQQPASAAGGMVTAPFLNKQVPEPPVSKKRSASPIISAIRTRSSSNAGVSEPAQQQQQQTQQTQPATFAPPPPVGPVLRRGRSADEEANKRARMGEMVPPTTTTTTTSATCDASMGHSVIVANGSDAGRMPIQDAVNLLMGPPPPRGGLSHLEQRALVAAAEQSHVTKRDPRRPAYVPNPYIPLPSSLGIPFGNGRKIVLDAPNVAVHHGDHRIFSVKGLGIVVEFFRSRGYDPIGFIPRYYMEMSTPMRPKKMVQQPDDRPSLTKLIDAKTIILTPSKDYDDSYSIHYAMMHAACIVSNDLFRDYINKSNDALERRARLNFIETYRMGFAFVRDDFVPNPDFVIPALLSKPTAPL